MKTDPNAELLGIVVWYIDDALVLTQPGVNDDLTKCVAGLWTTSPPEFLYPGQVLVYNGFEIEQEEGRILLHQKSFLTELLSRYPGTETAEVPALPLGNPEPEEANAMLTRRCQALCGEVLWLSIRSRPDLCYAVSMMSQRMSKFPKEAWERGQQILRYLRRHPGVCMVYGPPPSTGLAVAQAMSDASFAPNAERSHQCSLVFLGQALVTWQSRRQSFITQSTCESELVALVQGLQDLECQLPLFRELVGLQITKKLWCDNKSAIAICEAPFGSWRSRHLHLRANVIKERLSDGWELQHLAGNEMLADLGTKPLASSRFLELLLGLGMYVPVMHKIERVGSPEPCVIPGRSPIQNLVRALILLELLESLPVSEASTSLSPSTKYDWTADAVFGCLVGLTMFCWWKAAHYGTSVAIAMSVLCLAIAVQSPHWGASIFRFSWVLGLGALGIGVVVTLRSRPVGRAMLESISEMPSLLPLENFQANSAGEAGDLPASSAGDADDLPASGLILRYSDDLVVMLPPRQMPAEPSFLQSMIGISGERRQLTWSLPVWSLVSLGVFCFSASGLGLSSLVPCRLRQPKSA